MKSFLCEATLPPLVLDDSAMRALAKFEQLLPTRLRAQVAAVQAATETVAAGTPSVDHSTLLTLAQACRDLMRVGFSYESRDGTRTERRVEPHRLVCTGWRSTWRWSGAAPELDVQISPLRPAGAGTQIRCVVLTGRGGCQAKAEDRARRMTRPQLPQRRTHPPPANAHDHAKD